MLKLVGLFKALSGSLRRDDRGTTIVEYGALVVLIAAVVAPALIILGPIVAAWYAGIIGSL